jgi:tRNA threonylcarbamoyladenosine biosynthesis protein TsaB
LLTLALDTTTRGGGVAVMRGDRLLAVIDGDPSRTHGERLPAEIDAALQRAGVPLSAIELLAVASGPGAFTGLRIGLATMQGLAMVTGIPVIGVSALDALAHSVRDTATATVMSWMDAQRGEVFSARYDGPFDATQPVEAPVVATPSKLLASLDVDRAAWTFVGDGALRYRQLIESWGKAAIVSPVPALTPSLAVIGQRRARAGGAGPPHALQPLYVRRSDAELARGPGPA